MLSGDWGRGLAVRLRQGAQAPSHRDWGQVFPNGQVLVEEVIIRVVILCVVWTGEEEKLNITRLSSYCLSEHKAS